MNWTATLTFFKDRGFDIAIEILMNFILPYVIYFAADAELGDVKALLGSSLPPIFWSIFEFVRKRRVDALSLLVIAGLALSLFALLGGGSVRFLQLRENLANGIIALVFLVSAAIGKPLIYQLARAGAMRKKADGGAIELERLRNNEMFKRAMTVMTLVWGFGLLAQTLLACVLVYSISVGSYLLISPFIGYGTMGALGLWTFLYGKRMRRIGIASRAKADAKAVSSSGDGTLGL